MYLRSVEEFEQRLKAAIKRIEIAISKIEARALIAFDDLQGLDLGKSVTDKVESRLITYERAMLSAVGRIDSNMSLALCQINENIDRKLERELGKLHEVRESMISGNEAEESYRG
jgi:hypothetical protein